MILSSCATTGKEDTGLQLIINRNPITFNLAGGQFVEGELERAIGESKDDTITLPKAQREGYEFQGWVKPGDKTSDKLPVAQLVRKDVKDPITFTAKWNIIEYDITYNLDGIIGDKVVEELPQEPVVEVTPVVEEKKNAEKYTIVDEVTFVAPQREGFTFLGWTEAKDTPEESNVTADEAESLADSNYTIKRGSTGEKDLVAVWKRNTYTVTYDLNGGKLDEGNSESFTYGLEGFELNAPHRDYFVFAGWRDSASGVLYTNKFTGTTGTSDVTLTAEWTPDVFNITYDLDGGELPEDAPMSYTYETATFKLPTPVKDGYRFIGWTTEEVVDIEPVLFAMTFSIEGVDITIKVYSNKSEWVLPLDLSQELKGTVREYLAREFPQAVITINGNIITLDYSVGDSTILENIVKNIAKDAGFVYEYQKTKVEEVGYETVTIYQGSHGDRSYKANWVILSYSITYGSDEEYAPRIAEVIPTNPTRYTVEDVITINNMEKFGYDFMGWVLEDEEYTEAKIDLTLDEGSTGDRVYIPLFKLHNYSINLTLDGGVVDVPATFTIEDEDITIPEAKRDNYIFLGWLNEDGVVKKEVKVECKKGMDVNLVALWQPIEYKIEYDLNGGKLPIGSADNIEKYNVETEPFVLVNPEKDTYEFAGWVVKEKEGREWAQVDYTFDTTKGGNVSLKATWTEKKYNIIYDLNGGEFEYADSNKTYFTNFMDEFTIVSPLRNGWTFLGWVEEGNDNNKPVIDYVIKTKELRSDVSLKALWSKSAYSITYNLNGGNYSRGSVLNPESYSLVDKAFILTNPVRDGFEFLGWVRSEYSSTDKPSKVYRVDTSKGGDLSFDALWSADSYTLSYVLDGGDYLYGNSNPETYTTESEITLANPHKDGYTFLGWIRSGDPLETVNSLVTITPGTSGNLTFYAVYDQTLVALGETTKRQKEVIELGKNNIPRPDWVIEAPKDSDYHYERAYSSGSDVITNMENAAQKCREYIAQYITTDVSNVVKNVNGVRYNTSTVEVKTVITNSELVEYWEDAQGGVWVLMRIALN